MTKSHLDEQRDELRLLISNIPLDRELKELFLHAIQYGPENEVTQVVQELKAQQARLPGLLQSLREHSPPLKNEGELLELKKPLAAVGEAGLMDTIGSRSGNFVWGGEGFWIDLARPNGEPTVKVVLPDRRGDALASKEEFRISFYIYHFVEFFGKNWSAIKLISPNRRNSYEWSQERYSDRSMFQDRSLFEAYLRDHGQFDVIGTLANEDGVLRKQRIYITLGGEEIVVNVPKYCRLILSRDILLDAIEHVCDVLARDPIVVNTPAADAWRFRDISRPAKELIRLYTGVTDPVALARMTKDVADTISADKLLIHDSEVLALARMRPDNLSSNDLVRIFEKIDGVSHSSSTALDELSVKAQEQRLLFQQPGDPPYEQGYKIARWLRSELGLLSFVEPKDILKNWGISPIALQLSTRRIDAIGFWGPRRGPGILINKNGEHCESAAGIRATLAHEICHLIIDRGHALPLVDVLGGKVALKIEQRARAFAAEFLLPQETAYNRAKREDVSRPGAARRIIEHLTNKYHVSEWVAGYQIKNSLKRFAALKLKSKGVSNLMRELDLIVPERSLDDDVWE